MTVKEFLETIEEAAREAGVDVSGLEILITPGDPDWQSEVHDVFIHTKRDGVKVVLIEEF